MNDKKPTKVKLKLAIAGILVLALGGIALALMPGDDSGESPEFKAAAAAYGKIGQPEAKSYMALAKDLLPGGETDLSEEGQKHINGSPKGCVLDDETKIGGQWQVDAWLTSTSNASAYQLELIGEQIQAENPEFTILPTESEGLILSSESGASISLQVVGGKRYALLALSACNFS